ncbi:sulfurtransferase [Colwellia piezophila]|uniref:sulfurtransferase n=1 Tax=Colwellia piezophila TaxID=211668 RepID=UPI00037428B5|nr:sulfurtransferase [Colwellia piezophila]
MDSPLISVASLYERLAEDDLIIIDVSMKTVVGREPIVYDSLSVIPKSSYIDLSKDLVDHASSQVHSFPSQQQVINVINNLDITPNTTIVLYDNQGIYSSPRAWWIFKSFGLDNVYILDGGLPEWIKQNYPISSEYVTHNRSESGCSLDFNVDSVVFKQQVFANLSNKEFSVIDVRAIERFNGVAQEPRKGVRSGHIPNSINLPFELVLRGNKYKSPTELQKLFSSMVQDDSRRLVFSCGSGITACIGLVAALLTSHTNVSLYDGSWSEWGSDLSLPIEQS